MNVLLVSNQYPNSQGIGNPIMFRMCSAIENDSRVNNVEFIPFTNSLSSLKRIRKSSHTYDVVHIHFGGLYALIIWFSLIGVNCKKYITFHGTDIHAKALKTTKGFFKRLKIRLNQKSSFLCIILFNKCGFVAKEMIDYVPQCLSNQIKHKAFIQPLGVDYELFQIEDKKDAQNKLNIDTKFRYVLFSDISNTNIKRRDIAEEIIKCLGNKYKLLTMSGVKPNMVPIYINACDFLLLTSDEEGSPNIIREALSLNKPVFSVQVGDAAKQLERLKNSCIISRKPSVAASLIHSMLHKTYIDNTRELLRNRLDFSLTNCTVIDKYFE